MSICSIFIPIVLNVNADQRNHLNKKLSVNLNAGYGEKFSHVT